MKTVAYCSPWVPPEWIAAHGLRPRWLPLRCAHAPAAGIRRGVCPFAGAILSDIDADAVVLATTCDQMRRAADWIERNRPLPVFLLNVPVTWQTETAERLYFEELLRLGRFLAGLGGSEPAPRDLGDVMLRFDAARQAIRSAREAMSAREFHLAIAAVRDGALGGTDLCATGFASAVSGEALAEPVPPGVRDGALGGTDLCATGFASAVSGKALAEPVPPGVRDGALGGPDLCATGFASAVSGEALAEPVPPGLIPLALVGGPLIAADLGVFDLIERLGARIVLDASEGGERTLPGLFDLEQAPLEALARAYFRHIPDVFRRPNDRLYDWLREEIAARGVRGILLRRYLWCDQWHAELHRLKQWSRVPVLEIDVVDGEPGAPARTSGRIESFLEMLR